MPQFATRSEQARRRPQGRAAADRPARATTTSDRPRRCARSFVPRAFDGARGERTRAASTLVLASAVLGTLFGLQRRATGDIQAPILTH